MKKMIIFLAVIITMFVALAFVSQMKNEEKSEDNLYEKEELEPATVDQLDNELYQNQILPNELEEKLAKKEALTVYFYSPTCSHCVTTTPIVVPLTKEMDINLVQYNLLEFDQGWDEYQIESTPTIVQYKDGKEIARINGYHTAEEFRPWFEQNTK